MRSATVIQWREMRKLSENSVEAKPLKNQDGGKKEEISASGQPSGGAAVAGEVVLAQRGEGPDIALRQPLVPPALQSLDGEGAPCSEGIMFDFV